MFELTCLNSMDEIDDELIVSDAILEVEGKSTTSTVKLYLLSSLIEALI